MALPDHDSPLLEVRLRLARQIVTTLGLAPPASFVVPPPRTADTGAVKAVLAAHGTVTAVAAFDDDIALRTLTALHDLGLAAPDDLAVIGFDDTEYGALVTPALTTVHIDAEAHPWPPGHPHRARPRSRRSQPRARADHRARLGVTPAGSTAHLMRGDVDYAARR
jgi:hypothetical protein